MTPEDGRKLALAYLAAMEERDLDTARSLVAQNGAQLVFPGDRRFGSIDEIVANSGSRYRVVRKTIGESCAWEQDGTIQALVTGTLYGEWLDGSTFKGIRFIDRFEIRDGKIVRQEVWNDAGERILSMQTEAVS